MTQRVQLTLVVAFWVLLAFGINATLAAEKEATPSPQPVTTSDPEIPVDELALSLKPFTKDELLVEAGAWQGLLKSKAQEIARAEIAVKRQNREIATAEKVQDKAEVAKQKLDEVKREAEAAKASGDRQQVEGAEEAAREAQKAVREVSDTVEDAAAAAVKTAEAQAPLKAETRDGLKETSDAVDRASDAVDRVQQAVAEVDPKDGDSLRQAATVARDATQDAEKATGEAAAALAAQQGAETAQALDSTADAMAAAEDAKQQEKIDLLETVNALREERTQLIDRLKTVLDELEAKTDKEDADTLAQITDYRLYIKSVAGITLDVKDTTSAWVTIKGWLISDEGGLRWARNIGLFLGILFAAWVLSKILSRVLHRGLKMTGGLTRLLEDFLVGAVRWLVMAIGIIMALAALEVSVGPLLAVVGAAGFVVAFALQDSLSNFASGLMILFFRPFDVGDVVDAGGISGKVISLNLVSTTIKTFDNKDMVVPNNKIWHDVITNATAADTRRVDMEFGIGYDDDIDRAQAILEEIVEAHPKTLKDPAPTIRMNTLADSSVNFICRPWAKNADYWDVYWDVTKAVKQRFDAAGIGIPYPQRDVHLYIAEGPGREGLARVAQGTKRADASPPADALDDGSAQSAEN